MTKSIKPQVDPEKIPADVLESFTKQFNFMRSANEKNVYEETSLGTIELGNFITMGFEKPFVDLLITSPPYVTSYEYADLHQLSTLWLDYVKDYRDLRSGTIGSVYHLDEHDISVEQVIKPGKELVESLQQVDQHKAKAVAKYYLDMQNIVNKCYSIVKQNGMILFVIGDTEYKKVKILNSEHLLAALTQAGFVDLVKMKRKVSGKNLTPYRDQKGRFTTDKKQKNIYSEEYVITGRKPSEH